MRSIVAIWLVLCGVACGQVAVTSTSTVEFSSVIHSNYTFHSDGVFYANVDGTQYVDGVESTFVNVFYSTAGQYLTIGGISSVTVTDFRVYEALLSAEEISEIYHRPWSLADDPDLVLRTCVNDKWDKGHVEDMSGNGNTATNNGVDLVETSDGWVGRFIAAEGDYIDASSLINKIDGSQTNGTISMWVKKTTADDIQTVFSISKGDTGNYAQIALIADGNARFVMNTAGGITRKYSTGLSWSDGQWHNAIATRLGTTTYWYCDGVIPTLDRDDDLGVWMADLVSLAYSYIGGLYYAGSQYYAGCDVSELWISTNGVTSIEAGLIYSNGVGGLLPVTPYVRYTMQPSYLDTGDALTGVAPNLNGTDGTYSNSPTAAPWTIQTSKPRRATINID